MNSPRLQHLSSKRVRRRFGPRARGEAGLTLIEVMVAVVVFTVGALALAALIPTGMHRITDSEADTRASALASDRAERLLLTPYDDESLDAGSHNDGANPFEGLFNVAWSVEFNQPVTDCKRVTVTVRRAAGNRLLSRLVIVVPRYGG